MFLCEDYYIPMTIITSHSTVLLRFLPVSPTNEAWQSTHLKPDEDCSLPVVGFVPVLYGYSTGVGSGLKVNYTKTEAMWIGSSRNNTETPLALQWCKTVVIITKNHCKRIFTISSEESNPRYACGVEEATPCLVKSQLSRVFYFLKFYTSRRFFLLL